MGILPGRLKEKGRGHGPLPFVDWIRVETQRAGRLISSSAGRGAPFGPRAAVSGAQVGDDGVQVLPGDVFVPVIRHRREHLRAVLADAVRDGDLDLPVRPFVDARFLVGRDVGRIGGEGFLVEFEAAGQLHVFDRTAPVLWRVAVPAEQQGPS